MAFGTYQRLNVHVLASDREVIRATRKKISETHLYDRRARTARHSLYKEMLHHHKKARELYIEYRF